MKASPGLKKSSNSSQMQCRFRTILSQTAAHTDETPFGPSTTRRRGEDASLSRFLMVLSMALRARGNLFSVSVPLPGVALTSAVLALPEVDFLYGYGGIRQKAG